MTADEKSLESRPRRGARRKGRPARPRAVDPPPGERGAAEPFDLASLQFDLYGRHKLVQEVVGRIREGRPRLSILDVGGAPGHLRRFFPRDHLVILDREGGAGEIDARGEGFRLPFADRAFDVVVSLDTLEHLTSRRRPAFLRELARVTGDTLLLTAPFADPRVEEAESILTTFIHKRLQIEHRFLEEHGGYGLPDRARTVKSLGSLVGPVVAVPNGNLDRWLLMMGLSLYLDRDRNLADLKRQVNAYYNRNYYRGDNSEPAYRWMLAARREPASPLDPAGLGPEPGQGVRLDFSAMATLMEATGIDLLKDAYRSIEILQERLGDKDVQAASLAAERDHRQRVIGNLQEEIVQRQHRIEELRAELDARGEELEERGLRVVEVNQEIDRLREAGGEAAELHRLIDDHATHARDLSKLLHRQVERVDGLKGEVEKFGALAESLRERDGRVRELEDAVAGLRGERERARELTADLKRLSASLARKSNELAGLERHVRNLEEIRARLEERQEELEKHGEGLEKRLEEKERRLEEQEQRREELERRRRALEEGVAGLSREADLLRQTAERRQRRIEELEADRQRYLENAERLRGKLEEAQGEIRVRGLALDDLRDQLARQLLGIPGRKVDPASLDGRIREQIPSGDALQVRLRERTLAAASSEARLAALRGNLVIRVLKRLKIVRDLD